MSDGGKKSDYEMIRALAAAERLSVGHAHGQTAVSPSDAPQPPPRSIRPWLWRLSGPKPPPADAAHIIDVYERGIERIVRDHLAEMAKLRASLSDTSQHVRQQGEKHSQRAIEDLEKSLVKEKARVAELERLTNQLQSLHRAEQARIRDRFHAELEQVRADLIAEAQATQAATLEQVAVLERQIIDDRTRFELERSALAGKALARAEDDPDVLRLTEANTRLERDLNAANQHLAEAERKGAEEKSRLETEMATQVEALKGALALARQQVESQAADHAGHLAALTHQVQADRLAVEAEWSVRLSDLESRAQESLSQAQGQIAVLQREAVEARALGAESMREQMQAALAAAKALADQADQEMQDAQAQAQAARMAQAAAEQALAQERARREIDLRALTQATEAQLASQKAEFEQKQAQSAQVVAGLERQIQDERQAAANHLAVAVAKASSESQNRLVEAQSRAAEMERHVLEQDRRFQAEIDLLSGRFADAEMRAAESLTQVQDLTNRLEEAVRTLAEKDQVLAEKDQALAAIPALRDQIADLTMSLAEAQDKVVQLTLQLDERVREDQDFRAKAQDKLTEALEQVSQVRQEQEDERVVARVRAEELEAELAGLQTELDHLRTALDQSEAERHALQDSHLAELAGALAAERAEAEARAAQARRQHLEELASARANVGEDVQIRLAEVQATIAALMHQRAEEAQANAQAIEAARQQGAAEARVSSDGELALLKEKAQGFEMALREREAELARLHAGMDQELSRLKQELLAERKQATQDLSQDLTTVRADLLAAKERIAKLEGDLAKAPRRSFFGGSSGPSQAELNDARTRADDAEERAKLAENKVEMLKDALEIAKARANQPVSGASGQDRRFREVKRAFALKFHPDQGGRGDPEKERLFADFWPILERIDRGG